MQTYLLIASLGYLVSLTAAVAVTYLVASLKHEVKRLVQDNARLHERNAELQTNGEFPKRWPHAAARRIEDLMADADAIWDDLTLLQLHHKQAARLEGERLEDFNTRLGRLKARLSDARKASPLEYAEYK